MTTLLKFYSYKRIVNNYLNHIFIVKESFKFVDNWPFFTTEVVWKLSKQNIAALLNNKSQYIFLEEPITSRISCENRLQYTFHETK